MIDETVSIHSVTPTSTLADLTIAGPPSKQVVLTAPAYLNACQEMLNSWNPEQADPEAVTVFPIGRDGDLQWNHLPTDLALLSRFPADSAVLLTSVETLQRAGTRSLWEWLATDTNIDVRETIELASSNSVELPDLAPRKRSMPRWLSTRCANFQVEPVESEADAIAVKAGLFQMHDELDRSHDYAQDAQGAGRNVAGDYWHGIMHRREPDYGNSKYWFRRVGSHPVFTQLAEEAIQILQRCESSQAGSWESRLTSSSGWDPFAFVDLCETCERGSDVELTRAAKQIQWREMLLLLAQTYDDATA